MSRTTDSPRPANVLSIDVEDWFHILDARGAPCPDRWDRLPSRLERNTHRLLELLARHGVKATLFWLGWAAERCPELVRAAHAAGHEIASHGHRHLLVYEAGPQRFAEDVRRAKALLEDLCGAPVLGFRAPGFSFTRETPWAYQILAEAGYHYSSSIFPAQRGHGGLIGAQPRRHTVTTPAGPVEEFPITTIGWSGHRLCLFGGGYLRLSPWPLLSAATRWLNQRGQPVIFFIHPREIDADQPRMRGLPLVRYFKYYVNLKSTEGKLRRLMASQRFAPFRDWL